MRARPWRVALAGVALAGSSMAGSLALGPAPSPAGASAPARVTITIANFMFHPMRVRVAPGAIIRIVNHDHVEHTLTALGGIFNTGRIRYDATRVLRAPRRAGVYPFDCTVHPFMTGAIVVS